MVSKVIKSVCPYCGVGCGILMEVDDNRIVGLSGDKQHPTNFGRLCTKGKTSFQAVHVSGRLDRAYQRDDKQSARQPVPINVAIQETAQRLRRLVSQHGPDAVSFYVSGQISLEAQYLSNKLAKGFIGTNNIESNSRLCMASAGVGYKLSLGSDGPPGSYQDFDSTDLFFVIGADMADCHPILYLRMLDRLKAGARLIVVDPRRTTTADKADLFLQIKTGTDLALLNGLLALLVKNGGIDRDFISAHTDGWEAMPAFLEAYQIEEVARTTGLNAADITQAAEWIGAAANWMSCWTMGLNQSTHGTWNTNAICNLHLATGAICRPGSGPFSLTGQPNAMGGREMGYMGVGLPGQRSALDVNDRAFVESQWAIPSGTLRTEFGGGTISLFESMAAGTIKACWIIGTNPVATVPNRNQVITALKTAECVISQDAYLETETNVYADILLPGALWAEAEGVMINSERNMTLMQQAVNPPGEALPDWQIIARVASEMGFAESFSYASAAEVFEEIKQFWNPATGYDLRGASYERLRETPLQWPCPPHDLNDRHPIRYLNDGVSQKQKVSADGSIPDIAFPTPSGKGIFFPRPHKEAAELPDSAFPFLLNTGRLQHQWHTMTKTGKIPTLNKLNPAPFIEIHPEDAARLGIVEGDPIEITSRRAMVILPALISDRVQVWNCFAPFHWNDQFGDNLTVNTVTNDATDPMSLEPEFKCCAVSLKKSAGSSPKAVTDQTEAKASNLPLPIDRLAKSLGLDQNVPPELSADERLYLQGFMRALVDYRGAQEEGIPMLPPTAPIKPATRLQIDGLLAGMYSRSSLWVSERDAGVMSVVETESSRNGNPTVHILWASQTGNAEGFAVQCVERLKQEGYVASLACLHDVNPNDLAQMASVLFITSTFGDGDAPDNGAQFWNRLQSAERASLVNLSYAILALGDSSYSEFCGFGRKLDAHLETLGAKRMLDRTDCEPDFEEVASLWLERVVTSLQGRAGDDPKSEPPTSPLAVSSTSTETGSPGYHRKRPVSSRLLLNRRLNGINSEKEIRQFAFDLKGLDISYQVGESLGVYPTNDPRLIDELLTALKLPGDEVITVKDAGDMSLSEALLSHFEIARITPDLLSFVAERSGKQELSELLDEGQQARLQRWLWGRQICDVIREFPIHTKAGDWLSVLKPLQPRIYSISSSLKAHPDEAQLTVSVVRYLHGERARGGVCSTFLADRAAESQCPIFIQPSSYFHPPQDHNAPMIMIGPGTGVAPFRAFLQERRAIGAPGENWLFFGEQRKNEDFHYRDELEGYLKEGHLTRLDTAFSRDQAEKVYVQHRMLEHGAELWRWLEGGAYLFVCGDACRMAKDVDLALRQIVMAHGQLSDDLASSYVAQLTQEKRYMRDVY